MCARAVSVVPAAETEQWHGVLDRVLEFDFYHLPEYHLIAEDLGEGQGVLFVYQEGPRMVAWPMLLRPVEMVAGLEVVGQGLRDATSVYGYPGPVATPGVRDDPQFIYRFFENLRTACEELQVVSVFSRLNPVLENADLACGFGSLVPLGETVSVDLSQSPDEQWSAYRKSHRYEIRRAQREGMRAYRDEGWSAFDSFIHLYASTMERVGAAATYRFDESYFSRLREALGERLQLFVAELDGVVCSAALFVHTGDIIQYHLSGSAVGHAGQAPSKLVLDEARRWGNAVGARFLHLGGGVGSCEDSLFLFKAGFSPLRHRFFVCQCVLLEDVYSRLVDAQLAWLLENGRELAERDFFPRYRTGQQMAEEEEALQCRSAFLRSPLI